MQMNNPIKARREKLGWTQADLARRAGYSVTHISRIERGQVPLRPRAINTINICKALGMSKNDLYGTGKGSAN
jgi:transcriptional regulator with XRE-family HTH domain